MTDYATGGPAWTLVTPYEDVTAGDVRMSYASLLVMDDADRAGFGIYAVQEPDAPPAGKVEALRVLGGGARPAWSVTYRDPTVEELDALDPVPATISAAQGCIILEEDGFLPEVKAIIAQMPMSVQIWFERANDWERVSPYVAALALELNLSEDVIDEMFRRAKRRL